MIDFHTHIFPENIAKSTLDFLSSKFKAKPYTDGTATSLSTSAKAAGIALSIVLPVVTKPAQFDSINAFASGLQEKGLISFGGIHPDVSDYKAKLKDLKARGFKGIKLHPDYQDTFITDIRFKRILSYATELGLIISVHAGLDPGYPDCIHCTPRMIEEVISDVQPEKMVLAHMGGFQLWNDVERHLVGMPVYLDTAVVFGQIPDEQFIRICRTHGPDKVLFATDSPWSGQKESAVYLQNMALTDVEKRLIFHENAAKLLTL